MSWTLSTEALSIERAGANAPAAITGDAVTLALYSDLAEGRVVMETGKDWVADFGSLGAYVKGLLNGIVSAMVAQDIISFDIDAYGSSVGQTMLDYFENLITKGISTLKDFKSVGRPRSAV